MLHPVMMHTVMSFLGCIGTLMKESGVDVLQTAASGGVAGIITGKSWTNALRAYRLTTTMLLQDFLFLSEWRNYLPGAERLHGVSQRASGCEVMGGLSDQAHSSSLAVTACTERRRLPTSLRPGPWTTSYMTCYLRNVVNLPTAANNDLVKGEHQCRHSNDGAAVPVDQLGEHASGDEMAQGNLHECRASHSLGRQLWRLISH